MSLAFLISCCSAVTAASIALLVGIGARRSIAHWCFVAGMLVLAGESMCIGIVSDAILPDHVIYWLRWTMLARALIPFPWLAFSLTYARGNPLEQLYKARLHLLVSFLLPVGIALFFGLDLINAISQRAEDGIWVLRWGMAGKAFSAVSLVLLISIIMNLERTFRASIGTMRWRIKYMILGLGVCFVVRAYTSSQVVLFPATNLTFGIINNAALLVGCLMMLRSIFRAGNFEVSVYPSQTILANSFTVVVAGIYLVAVGLLAKLVTFFGGETAFALKAFIVLVALVLLAIVLLSDRARLFTRRFVSRHFQRPVFDYRTLWQKLTQATARCVEQNELCTVMARLTSDVFQCLSVTIWLVDDRKESFVFAASTSLLRENADGVSLNPEEGKAVIAALTPLVDPIDIDTSQENFAVALRTIHPDQFRKGGNRVCVPMVASGELLGIMNLGDRVSGVPFTIQDMDLLKSVAGHAAASLLSIRLLQRLSQAKQLEAFQAMSAFFVHDLKNTASTLSLMLQNLPVHYQDPSFREDALRGISKTVTHINDLITRLNMLRHELKIQAVDCDLNELVTESLKAGAGMDGIEVVRDLKPLPKVRIDPLQVQKVLTNLLLNSRDALPRGGQIRIETGEMNGWAVLTVSDNGCGMSPEFIRSNLFRPFQTTKKNGIGIGMFHCKTIVEAHRGRIEVESELGKGTAFRILFPLSAGPEA